MGVFTFKIEFLFDAMLGVAKTDEAATARSTNMLLGTLAGHPREYLGFGSLCKWLRMLSITIYLKLIILLVMIIADNCR